VIVKALQDWRPYLADTEKPIQIYTDHKNLRNFATTKQLNQQVCWAEQLVNYKFQIHYKKSNENGEADALSRQPDHKEVKRFTSKFWVKTTRKSSQRLSSNVQGEASSLDRWRTNTSMSQQQAMNTLKSKELRTSYKEDTISVTLEIKSLSTLSDAIHVTETRFRDKRYDRVTQLDTLNAPWESVTMNFITKLLTSKNPAWGVKFDSILTIVDRLTKYTMFISFKKTTTASVLMYTILQELINNHRLSKNLSLTETSCLQASFEKRSQQNSG
jgi:hypothetical protein